MRNECETSNMIRKIIASGSFSAGNGSTAVRGSGDLCLEHREFSSLQLCFYDLRGFAVSVHELLREERT